MIGTITKGIGGFYYISTEKGIVECRARGKFRKQKITPMVGDKVDIEMISESPLIGSVDDIYPRKNSLIRPPVSNIDTVVIVVATINPNPDFFMIDKLIASAENSEIEIIIAVNKADLSQPDEIIDIYSSAGYKAISICAKNGEGTDELKAAILGRVTAFAGNSGVGKSSILNYLGFSLETGSVSKINRGKHTTRHIELMPYENGFVIDTPGFSLLEINELRAEDIKNLFAEFKPHNDNCKFTGCTHVGASEADCAVLMALSQGKIKQTRYNSYVEIYNSLKNIKDWQRSKL